MRTLLIALLALASGCGAARTQTDASATGKAHVYEWRASATCSAACPWETSGELQALTRDEVANWLLDQVSQYAEAEGDSTQDVGKMLDALNVWFASYVQVDFTGKDGIAVRFQLYTAEEALSAEQAAL